jgi:hypothetical protein
MANRCPPCVPSSAPARNAVRLEGCVGKFSQRNRELSNEKNISPSVSTRCQLLLTQTSFAPSLVEPRWSLFLGGRFRLLLIIWKIFWKRQITSLRNIPDMLLDSMTLEKQFQCGCRQRGVRGKGKPFLLILSLAQTFQIATLGSHCRLEGKIWRRRKR